MIDLGQGYTFNPEPLIAQLKRVGEADNALTDACRKNTAERQSFFQREAQASIAAQNAQIAAALEVGSAKRVAAELTAELRRQTTEYEKLERAAKKATGADEQKRLQRELEKNAQKIKEVKVEQELNNEVLAKAAQAVEKLTAAKRQEEQATKLQSAAQKDLNTQIKAEIAADKEAEKAGKGSGGGGFFGSLLGRVTAAGAGLFAFDALSRKVKDGLEAYGDIKGVQNTLKFITGSSAGAAKELVFLKQAADGLDFVPTAQGYVGLLAAAKGANIPLSVTRDLFTSTVAAGKLFNFSQDKTNGILLAFQQIASKGKVSAEELRGQLAERLPEAEAIAAKAMGLTTAQLSKQLETGKILSADFLPKFSAALKIHYADASADAADSVQANLGRINTFFSQSSAFIGAIAAPVVAALAALVTGTKTSAEVAEKAAGSYFKQADSLREMKATVGPLLSRYNELTNTTDRNATQQKELDTVMQQLAKSVPGAVTEFDKYGKALGINEAAVASYIKQQENLTRYMNREAIARNVADLAELKKKQDDLNFRLNRTATNLDGSKSLVEAQVGFPTATFRKLSPAESAKATTELTDQLAKIREDVAANLAQNRALRGLSPFLPLTPADVAKQVGLLDAIDAKIKDVQERQRAVATTRTKQPGGADFLLGTGGLDEQLATLQKQREELLGKVDKGAKSLDNKLAAALKALLGERAKLAGLAEKAGIKQAEDETQRAELVFRQALGQVDKIEEAIKKREAAYKALGGKGENADGQLTGEQAKQATALRLQALDAYYNELYRITLAREQRLFDLREETDEKQIAQVNRKYDAMLAAQHLGQSAELDALDEAAGIAVDRFRKRSQEEIAIEEARQRELTALRARQEAKRIELEKNIGDSTAGVVGLTYGKGTGISKIEAEEEEQRLRLANQRKFLEDSLNNTLNKNGKEAEAERAALREQLLRVGKQQEELERQASRSKFSIYRLVLGENDSDENRQALDKAVAATANAVSQVYQADIQASQAKIQAKTTEIDELQRELDREYQYNSEGSASNIANKKAEIEALKQQRREAIEEQKRAQKAQLLLDTALQASSLITAVSETYAGFAAIPIVGPALGIAAGALLIGSFIAAKSSAFAAINSQGGGQFFTGGFTEPGGPADKRTPAGTVHRGEFVANQELTRDHYALFKALHEGRRLDAPSLASLEPLLPAPLLPDYGLPARLMSQQQQYKERERGAGLGQLEARLAAIEHNTRQIQQSNQQMANMPLITPIGENRVERRWGNGSVDIVTYPAP